MYSTKVLSVLSNSANKCLGTLRTVAFLLINSERVLNHYNKLLIDKQINPCYSQFIKRKWVFTVQHYCSSGLPVSFFILRKSYKYFFPSSACLTNIFAEKILYLISSLHLSSYTGNANRTS